ncbi:hypothetical protein B566_EDAN011265 [Ephemera danica]|nr:hypothetical protein B566_EDAN011265 [Ephemera danica]
MMVRKQSTHSMQLVPLALVLTAAAAPSHLVIAASIVTEAPTELRIVSRDEWYAREYRTTTPQRVPVPFVVIHHGGIPEYCINITTCSEQVRKYQMLHMDDRGWDDIGYSFLVGEDGNVYEGRGWRRVGAHAPQYNNQSIGICIIGDFSKQLPNKLALDAVHALIKHGVQEGLILPQYTLLGHRQVRETQCPGEALYQEIMTWTHFDLSPFPRKYCTPCNPITATCNFTTILPTCNTATSRKNIGLLLFLAIPMIVLRYITLT